MVGCHSSHPDKIILKGKIDIPSNYQISLRTKQEKLTVEADSLTHTYSLELNNSASGFFTIQGIVETPEGPWQFSQDLFCSPGTTIQPDLKAGERKMEISVDPKDKNNSALVDYNRFSLTHLYKLWTNTPPTGEAKIFLQQYIDSANYFSEKKHLKEPVKKYLQIKSYLDYTTGINHLAYIYKQDGAGQLPAGLGTGLPAIETILDDSLALLFPDDLEQILYQYLSKQSDLPEDQLKILQEKFTQPQIREILTSTILEIYVQSYNYSQDFESGLSRLQAMCTPLPDKGEKYIRNFEAKRHTIAGSSLPDATLETPDGKRCKLSELKGKNLYIDLWASWCVPCCKEVPYLQKLEKEIKNKKVKFISISIDENKEAWKERMQQLHMEGNQYIVVGQELNNMLNVQSIPHFLIYNAEGKLIQYKAPRPSEDEEVRKILNSLK